jgi:hypothetical protein
MVKYTSPPIEVKLPANAPVSRADIEFEGVEHGGLSYEARVFLNNPNAGPETAPTTDNGYAGSFHVYGFGTENALAGEASGAAAGVPMQRSMTVTDAGRRLLGGTSKVVVTVVPVLPEHIARTAGDVLKIRHVAIKVA